VRYIILAVFAVLSSLSCHSQKSAQFLACTQKDGTQAGLDHCASDEAARRDADLNRTYQQLRSKAKQSPGATEKIERAELAWIQYRDAYLDAMFPAEDKQANYGSIYPMDFALLRADLTQEQTKRLKELIKQYVGDAQ
jgi:uncharacterized protein YecT (DUF1311 family)